MSQREKGIQAAQAMLGNDYADMISGMADTSIFARDMADMALRNVYGDIWQRADLGAKERSLVTLGILIALGQTTQIRYHVRSGIANGLTVRELEEVVLQAVPYAGYPLASTASGAVIAELVELGLLDKDVAIPSSAS